MKTTKSHGSIGAVTVTVYCIVMVTVNDGLKSKNMVPIYKSLKNHGCDHFFFGEEINIEPNMYNI